VGPGGGGADKYPFYTPPPTLLATPLTSTTFQTPDIHNLSPSARVSQSLPPLQYSRTFTSHSRVGGSLYSHTYISLGAAYTPTHISHSGQPNMAQATVLSQPYLPRGQLLIHIITATHTIRRHCWMDSIITEFILTRSWKFG